MTHLQMGVRLSQSDILRGGGGVLSVIVDGQEVHSVVSSWTQEDKK